MQIWNYLRSEEFKAIFITITVGIIIRFIYDFLVKPIFQKKSNTSKSTLNHPNTSKKPLKSLCKNLKTLSDRRILFHYLEQNESTLYRDFAEELRPYLKEELSSGEKSQLDKIIKKIKKL